MSDDNLGDTLDQAKASRCHAADTCVFDDACPFIIDCDPRYAERAGAEATTCHNCLIQTTDQRALLWDGALWRVYPHIDDGMKWGPYCAACALRMVEVMNANHVQPEEAPSA
jgi:hypothetical protein